MTSTTVNSSPTIFLLKPVLQPFPYGKEGEKSLAAQLAKSALGEEVSIDPKQPYGEIWIGSTHPNGSSTLYSSSKTLHEIISSNPVEFLGEKAAALQPYAGGLWLPFLFKVLSFDKALPLQAHPDKSLGTKLWLSDIAKRVTGGGGEFVDANAKPECFVALADFTAFVGFCPLEEIYANLDRSNTMKRLLPDLPLLRSQHNPSSSDQEQKAGIRAIFQRLITLTADDIAESIEAIEKEGEKSLPQGSMSIWNKCRDVYGKDVGLLVTTFMMNLVNVKEGEGMWILADDIHAYVEGDCVECMANSDNMVCHGLGQEAGGVQTFVDMLSYRHVPASSLRLNRSSRPGTSFTTIYSPPIPEFNLLHTSLSGCESELLQFGGPLVLLVLKGSAVIENKMDTGERMELGIGHSIFVKAGTEIRLESRQQQTELWGAFYE
ncbi:RmlC-like cupin [Atractiella rhizophila]|nr:RmlC-like cupin [Atractiella rhizophila]